MTQAEWAGMDYVKSYLMHECVSDVCEISKLLLDKRHKNKVRW